MNKEMKIKDVEILGGEINFFALTVFYSNNNRTQRFSGVFSLLLFSFVLFFGTTAVFTQAPYPPPNYFNQNQNFMANSTTFRQEIARLEINVARGGQEQLPISQVPRLEKDDVLKVRLLEEPVNGLKPDQSNYDWTFLVAFLNPGFNNDSEKTVSQEIQFRKSGWYKEYSFVVPYDSQPIFFIYPKSNYRDKILKLVTKNKDEIRKIGEKTIEISGAYAKIGSFLNELQSVLYRSQYQNSYGGYGYGYNNQNQNFFMDQAVERLARSFNIQLPNCWQNPGYGGYNNYGTYGNQNYYGTGNDFTGRVQCIAKSVRLEDLDFSVSQMLQQGGILVANQLARKYPQIAFWINIAAAALDFILQVTKKTPLKLVPTIITTNEYSAPNAMYQNNYAATNPYSPPQLGAALKPDSVKISLFAESSPNNSSFVTAYPLVVHKWQAEPDPDVLSLPIPVLEVPCLKPGQNVLKSTDLMNDWMSDSFTKDFKLVATSGNGFRREFPLKKNVGLEGWEFIITKDDLSFLPKFDTALDWQITGKRGFNEIKSPKFEIAIPAPGGWEIETESQKTSATDGKRVVTLKNRAGGCKCLHQVVFKPALGGQVIFEAGSRTTPLIFSPDGKEVSFELNGAQTGQAQLELRQFDGELETLNLNLNSPPVITDLKLFRGDAQALIFGERLEQIKAVRINRRRARLVGNASNGSKIYSSMNANAAQNNNLVNGSHITQATLVFDDPDVRLDSDAVSLELEAEDGQVYLYPRMFPVSPSRPKLVSGETKEIEATPLARVALNSEPAGNKSVSGGALRKSQPDLNKSLFFPIDSFGISLFVQNALTDYDFNAQNIHIETRIENGQVISDELPTAAFEVLDWKNIRVKWNLNDRTRVFLGGKRLQFRIRDKKRGDSEWYTVMQTFLRIPQNISVKCLKDPKKPCELRGIGIKYIHQLSVDGGKTWFPDVPGNLLAKLTEEGLETAEIPRFFNKRLLRIRLKDFPTGEGFTFSDYVFTSPNGK